MFGGGGSGSAAAAAAAAPIFGNSSSTSYSSSSSSSSTFGTTSNTGSTSRGDNRENPLLKKGRQSAPSWTSASPSATTAGGGGFGFGGNTAAQTSSSSSTSSFGNGRSPLATMDMSVNTKNGGGGINSANTTTTAGMTKKMSFGIPPKYSLSLRTGPAVAAPTGFRTNGPSQHPNGTSSSSPVPHAPVETPTSYHHPVATSTATALTAAMSSPPSSNASTVVAYGYRTQDEFEQLKTILMGYGNVIQFKTQMHAPHHLGPGSSFFAYAGQVGSGSGTTNNIQSGTGGGNWLAVQYESEFAAQQAVCNQPYVLTTTSSSTGGGGRGGGGATICGVMDGRQNGILDRLVEASTSAVVTTTRPGGGALGGRGGRNGPSLLQLPESSSIAAAAVPKESDILNYPHRRGSEHRSNNNSYSNNNNNNRSISICQQVFCWLLGWDPNDMIIVADDDEINSSGNQHPHSD